MFGLKLSRTSVLCVVVGSLNFCLGVALTGAQAERKLNEISTGLVPHGLRIDRCITGFEIQKISEFPCNAGGSTNATPNTQSAPIATPNAQRAD